MEITIAHKTYTCFESRLSSSGSHTSILNLMG